MIKEHKGVLFHFCDNCSQKINRSKTEGYRWNHCRICIYEYGSIQIPEFCSQKCCTVHVENQHSQVNLV